MNPKILREFLIVTLGFGEIMIQLYAKIIKKLVIKLYFIDAFQFFYLLVILHQIIFHSKLVPAFFLNSFKNGVENKNGYSNYDNRKRCF